MFSFFNQDNIIILKNTLKKFCEQMNYNDLILTDEELAQLSFYIDNSKITPEAKEEDILNSIPFEIKRCLTRCYSFELLLKGDEQSYIKFIQSQKKETKLPFNAFKTLSDEAISLSQDIKTALRASCFLLISDKIKLLLKENNHTLSEDSEEFLSQLAILLQKNKELLPITNGLTISQIELLQKIFWPTMHFRHMLYTEGGINMTKTFSEGVLNEEFNGQDFMAWKWRWLINLFGFQSGPGAKYFDSETHQLSSSVITELEKILTSPQHSYLDNYLLLRAQLAGFNDNSLELSEKEQALLGHLAAYFHQVNILSPELGKALYLGYLDFKKNETNNTELANLYEIHRQNKETITPTYVPAIINNSYLIFKNKFNMSPFDAVKNATQFMCQFLQTLYSLPHHQRISCMNFAKESNLQNILEKWYGSPHNIEFNKKEEPLELELIGKILDNRSLFL